MITVRDLIRQADSAREAARTAERALDALSDRPTVAVYGRTSSTVSLPYGFDAAGVLKAALQKLHDEKIAEAEALEARVQVVELR